VEYSSVPFDAGAAGMLTLAEARSRFAGTEVLGDITFWTRDPALRAVYGKGWAEVALTEPAPVWLYLPDGRFPDGRPVQLTRQAAQQLGSTCKANKRYQEFIPPEKLSDLATWALQEGLKESELKLLTSGTGAGPDDAEVPLAVAQARATVTPFSNLRLLDLVLLAARAKLGNAAADGAVVDYKLWHDLEHSSFRVVFPLVQQVVTGTGTDDDAWAYGIEVSNSATGAKQTRINGYMFRFATTAGITDVEHSAGGFNRRGSSPEAVYAWAADAAGDILDGPAEAFNGLQVLTERNVNAEYERVLAQLFHESPVSKELKLRILAGLEESLDDFTMFSLAHASAEAANLDGTTWREARSLFDLAGHIVHQGGGMCDGSLPDGCRRLLDKDWEAEVSD
jgi:hypothetical protein